MRFALSSTTRHYSLLTHVSRFLAAPPSSPPPPPLPRSPVLLPLPATFPPPRLTTPQVVASCFRTQGCQKMMHRASAHAHRRVFFSHNLTPCVYVFCLSQPLRVVHVVWSLWRPCSHRRVAVPEEKPWRDQARRKARGSNTSRVSIMLIQRVQGDRVSNKKHEPRVTNRHSIPGQEFPWKVVRRQCSYVFFNKKRTMIQDH